MKFRKSLVLLVLVLLIGIAGCAKQTQETTKTTETPAASDKINEHIFVDANWLKANLDKVIVLDTRTAKDYDAGHIPGAINATWQSLANMTGKSGEPGWGTILPANELAAKLSSMGIDGKKTVVTYATPPGWGEEGRVMWVLQMAGIKDVKMLNGGWKAWQGIQGTENKEVPKPNAVTFSIAGLDQTLNVTTDYLKTNQNKIKIIDARSDKEYKGATDYGEARGGHVPGAINLPFTSLFKEDGTIKSSDDLKKLFADTGLKTDDEIVCYCTKGIRSGYMTMILRNLGYTKAHNWDASYYEWAGNASLSVEK